MQIAQPKLLNYVKKLFLWISFIEGVKVAQS